MFTWDLGKRALSLAAIAAAAALMPASIGHAAVVVNDTWLDGTDSDPAAPTYSENGVDADADGNIESVWFQGGVGTLDPVGLGGPLRGNMTAGGTTSATWTTYATPEASPITLAQGDTVRVTWKFALTNVNAGNTSQNFRLAFVDSPSASRISANGTPGNAAYTGYAMFMNMSPTLGNSNPFRLMERDGTTAALLSASTPPWTPLANGATTGNHGYDNGVEYTYTMDITRNALDGLDIVSTMSGGTLDNDGTAQVVFTDATPNGGSFTFDTFAIRPSGATTTAELFDTSLFQVEHIVPEPSSLALLGFGALAALRRRRQTQA
ncbi:MAG: hypothetical protein QOF78_127 [Phycisphaerales bacterium]|jgi:hypothetical protein|nr:hypothetical protein [Phycisphaerales bacterium]